MNRTLVRVLPEDEHNVALVENTHPRDWEDPTPEGTYNMVVIGGGTAGLIAALGTAGLGGRVALIERHLLGGDCLNFGCVPSKGVLAGAHVAKALQDAAEWGAVTDVRPDFATVMRRMRAARAHISHHDSAERLASEGVDVFLGSARFTGPDTVEVNGQTLKFARAVIATGARPSRPPIPGLDTVDVRTNEDIFELTELPRRLAIVGAGPIGCELAQAFHRFGSEVTLIDLEHNILPNDDPEASALLWDVFEEEGIDLCCGVRVLRIGRDGDDKVVVVDEGGEREIRVDEVLLSAGRTPNVEGMDLERAGVEHDEAGVKVDAWLRTTNPRVYASGDVCSKYRFTHAADAMSRIVIQNALFFGRKKVDDLVIPWTTYTDPEVAHVGITSTEARKRGDVLVFTEQMERNDRSFLEGETRGFVQVYADKKGRILGATVVARHAGELVGSISMAMTNGLSLGALNDTIFPYPTRTEVLKRVAGQYNRTRLTAFTAWLLELILRWRR